MKSKIQLYSTLRVTFRVGYISVRLHGFGFSSIEAVYVEKEREVCEDSTVGSCFLRNQRCLKETLVLTRPPSGPSGLLS